MKSIEQTKVSDKVDNFLFTIFLPFIFSFISLPSPLPQPFSLMLSLSTHFFLILLTYSYILAPLYFYYNFMGRGEECREIRRPGERVEKAPAQGRTASGHII